jgi:hypothetical protein
MYKIPGPFRSELTEIVRSAGSMKKLAALAVGAIALGLASSANAQQGFYCAK